MSHIKLELIRTGVYVFLKMVKQTKGKIKIIADIIGKNKSTQLLGIVQMEHKDTIHLSDCVKITVINLSFSTFQPFLSFSPGANNFNSLMT